MTRIPTNPVGPRKVCVGCIVGPHGVRGLVTLRPYTQNAEDIVAYGPLETDTGRPVSLCLKGRKKAGLIAEITGVDSREAAETLKGVALFVDHANLPALPADEWYHDDLIGLRAVGDDDTDLGKVIAVQNFGAGDLLEVQPLGGSSFYVPLTRDAVPEIDTANGHLTITAAGLIDDTPQAQDDPPHGQDEGPGND
ncbi:MAG: ribosome maturation factor RimM [Alphaproteobacteria bacterium]